MADLPWCPATAKALAQLRPLAPEFPKLALVQAQQFARPVAVVRLPLLRSLVGTERHGLNLCTCWVRDTGQVAGQEAGQVAGQAPPLGLEPAGQCHMALEAWLLVEARKASVPRLRQTPSRVLVPGPCCLQTASPQCRCGRVAAMWRAWDLRCASPASPPQAACQGPQLLAQCSRSQVALLSFWHKVARHWVD